MRLKALLICLIPALMALPVRAQNTASPGDDLQKDLTGAAGGTLTLAAGTYNVTTPLSIPSGTTMIGTVDANGNMLSHVVFTLAGGDTASFGFSLDPGIHDITISTIDFVSNHGLLEGVYGSAYTNITITQNQIQTGTAPGGAGTLSDGTLVFGIYIPIPATNLQITHNYFHDSINTARNWTTFYSSNSNYDYNLFFNINDGGQINYPGANVSFSNNYGTQIQRMGQEIPCVTNTTNLQVNNNTFYDYINPYYNTEGVSVVGPAVSVSISGNYFDASRVGAWGQADSSGVNRFGYAIECTGGTCTVNGNTLVGPWAEMVSSDVTGANVTNNSVYGSALWGDFEGEPGSDGYGSVVTSGNSIDQNGSDAPAPETVAVSQAGPGYNIINAPGSTGPTGGSGSSGGGSGTSGYGGGGSTAPGPGNSITGVVVKVLSDTSVKVTWNSPSSDIASAYVKIISTVGRQNFNDATVPTANLTASRPYVEIDGLHMGWYIDFTVVATGSGSDPTIYKSNPVTAYLPGNYNAPWQGLLWGGISTLQTDPYVQ